ncbi:mitochondrial outer membrane protein mmm1 [Moniliophthora roreri MCA 2997]|uniref:Maintenance of mitochondrial morphology protein 1 n=2 Tax=Moniliophthora roreri TaxID=221103 RepID=V2Y0R3_MONRO|nr:mitochondrial outer membrane protein mmm1 [Moniliophthora roreri MCA 2997]KAI3622545.1 mitochondrial outer membrane protein mmm1 [Moniliophthora roreri]
MASNYLFTLQPNFTQGFIFGQLSILVLLYLILKYLFLDSTKYPFETSSYHPKVSSETLSQHQRISSRIEENENTEDESAEWFNLLLHQVVDVYRSKLRNDMSGIEGDEVARRRVEEYANKIRPVGFLDPIVVHSVNLGCSAPRLYNGHRRTNSKEQPAEIEFNLDYVDSISVSLSTSYLFNYPMPSFARLPISLTISLSQFKSSISIIPPAPTSHAPVLTFTISPTFTLDLTTASLMGSRAKLANVPKLHELIQHQVHRVLASRATWKVVLPGLASVAEAEQEIKRETHSDQ